MTRKHLTREPGEEICGLTSPNRQNNEDTFLVAMLTKGWPEQERVDGRTHSLTVKDFPSPGYPVISQWDHEENSSGPEDRVYSWHSSMALHSTESTWLEMLLSTQSTCSRNQQWVFRWIILPGGWTQLFDGMLIALDHSHHGRNGRCFVLILISLHMNLLYRMQCCCQNSHPQTSNMPYTTSW